MRHSTYLALLLYSGSLSAHYFSKLNYLKIIVSDQLSTGFTVKQIMAAIQSASRNSSPVKRLQIKIKDIHNIKRDFDIVGGRNIDAGLNLGTLNMWANDIINKLPVNPTDKQELFSDYIKEVECSPITKAKTFIDLYERNKCSIGEENRKIIDNLLTSLINACSVSSTNYLSSSMPSTINYRSRTTPIENDVPFFKEKNVLIHSNNESNSDVEKELFEMEEVFEESEFYENVLHQEFLGLNGDILGEVNVHTEFDHSYL